MLPAILFAAMLSSAGANQLENNDLGLKYATSKSPTRWETEVDLPTISIPDSLFLLSPGDGLLLRWWGIGAGEERLQVDTRYDIVIPDFGRLNVRSRSLKVVRDSIEHIIRKHVRADLIDLKVYNVASARVYVTGYVPSSGMFIVPFGTRASQVLAQSGISVRDQLSHQSLSRKTERAVETPVPSLRHTLLIRSSGDSIWLDLAKAFNLGIESEDPPLFTGDVLKVFPRRRFLEVTGGAPRPGEFEVLDGETGNQLLAAIGVDPLPANVQVITWDGARRSISVDQKLDSSVALIHVPFKPSPLGPDLIWVFGRVRNPGPVEYKGAMTADNAIAAAGGVTVGEDSGVVATTKYAWTSLTAPRSPRTLEAFQNPELRAALSAYSGRSEGNYSQPTSLLQPGDTVWVHSAEPVVWVGGEVRRPGFVPWSKDRSIDDFVAMAGGYAGRPWKSKAVVFDLYTQQQVRGSDPIRPGAAIIVPEKRYIDPLTWLAAVGTIVSLFVTAGTFYITATQ